VFTPDGKNAGDSVLSGSVTLVDGRVVRPDRRALATLSAAVIFKFPDVKKRGRVVGLEEDEAAGRRGVQKLGLRRQHC
jgi:hypothetical protein